ncbi:hypothetical protein NMY22_g19036 [Coprinellus aureogranulatus]|nr:hypothetical protein NMY22_g19036 [Coprinellus aureogranulatus]
MKPLPNLNYQATCLTVYLTVFAAQCLVKMYLALSYRHLAIGGVNARGIRRRDMLVTVNVCIYQLINPVETDHVSEMQQHSFVQREANHTMRISVAIQSVSILTGEMLAVCPLCVSLNLRKAGVTSSLKRFVHKFLQTCIFRAAAIWCVAAIGAAPRVSTNNALVILGSGFATLEIVLYFLQPDSFVFTIFFYATTHLYTGGMLWSLYARKYYRGLASEHIPSTLCRPGGDLESSENSSFIVTTALGHAKPLCICRPELRIPAPSESSRSLALPDALVKEKVKPMLRIHSFPGKAALARPRSRSGSRTRPPERGFARLFGIYIRATASHSLHLTAHPLSTNMSTAEIIDRDVTPSGRARPICHLCSQYKKNHNLNLCLTVQQAKQDFAARQMLELPTKLEGGAPSISQASVGVRNQAAAPTLPNVPEEGSIGDIILPVRRKPSLTGRYGGRYSPILELTVLLEIKSLRLSHFHLTRAGDWGFVITGKRAEVVDWVAETKVQAKGNMKQRRNCLHSAAMLTLGMILGFFIVLLIAYSSMRI